MPVHIKGGGGVGFPADWKEHFKGIVHEAAISKGDPVVVGTYADIASGMDIRNTPSLNGYSYDKIEISNSGKMFVKTSDSLSAQYKNVYIFNDATLQFDAIALPASTTTFYRIIAAAFSADDKYLALIVGTSSASGNHYLELYKIVGTTVTFISEQTLVGGSITYAQSIASIAFFNYLSDSTLYRILAMSGGYSGYYYFNSTTNAISKAQAPTAGDAGFVKRNETSYITKQNSADTTNRIFTISGDLFNTTHIGYVYMQQMGRTIFDMTESQLYAAIRQTVSPWFLFLKDAAGTNSWATLANPDVLPGGSIVDAQFSPGGTYLAVAVTVSPYLIIYRRDGDVLTKIANPTTMPTKQCNSVRFSNDGKLLFVTQGNTTAAASSVFCYGFEGGNIVSKITSFVANPLSWFPGPRQKFGVALDAGAVGSEIRVNLFPKLNNLSAV